VVIVIPYLKTRLESEQYSWAAEIIEHAVRAFEQTVSGSGLGEEKFQLVISYAKRELEKRGIKLTEEQITMLIEAAVQTMNCESLNVLDCTTESTPGVIFASDNTLDEE
jgi:LL-H family phage holin